MADFGSFFNAIAGQESGGDYKAVNSLTGALGKYQILPGNIGPWSKQYLGYTITPQDFEDSPHLQDQLASSVLKDYFTKWGPEGAASAWYSGSPTKWKNTGAQKGGPSIAKYVQDVMSRMGAAGSATAQQGLADAAQPAAPTGVEGLSSPLTPDFLGAGPTNPMLASAHRDPAFNIGGGNDFLGAPATKGPPTATAVGSTSVRDKMIAKAMQYIGVPYVWGGSGPKGFDCSGFTQYAMKSIGVNIPRISFQQANAGQRTAISNLQPGDLVAWDENSRNNGADHIAIYIGNGTILEAPHTGANVRTRKLSASEMNSGNVWGVHLTLPGDH